MKSNHEILSRMFVALFAVIFLFVTEMSVHADENWKGPGWYQVFDDGQGIEMIWTGPYPNEGACRNFVKGRFADRAYVQSMIVKYGDPKVWGFNCPYLKKDLPD
jgi:hypothetical protein